MEIGSNYLTLPLSYLRKGNAAQNEEIGTVANSLPLPLKKSAYILLFKGLSPEDNFLKYTITTCKLDRKYLNDERRKILDRFKNEIQAELVNSKNEEEQRQAIAVLVRRFVQISKDLSNEYIAFRKYSISNDWLKEIVQELN